MIEIKSTQRRGFLVKRGNQLAAACPAFQWTDDPEFRAVRLDDGQLRIERHIYGEVWHECMTFEKEVTTEPWTNLAVLNPMVLS